MIDDFQPKRPPAPKPGNDPKPEELTGFKPNPNGVSTPPSSAAPKEQLSYRQQGDIESKPEVTPMPIQSKPKKSKKKKFFITLLVLLILGGIGYGVWYFGIRDDGKVKTNVGNVTPTEEVVEEEKEPDNTAVAPLSGMSVDPKDAARPVTGIMIENSGEARPQSGLYNADLVFEAIAEGGITRFLALYQNSQPQYIGPIRSARPYYVEWAATFDATYIHAGGSPDGQQRIKDLGVKDLSAFSDTDVFYRTTDRFAPHNLYSSFKGIDELNQKNGYTKSTFTAWQRKDDVPQSVKARTIHLDISSDFFNVDYTYDPATNTYLRSEGGAPHLDEKSGKQLAPKTVIAMAMNWTQNGIYSVYTTTGSGKMIVFQDGVASEGTWSRSGPKDQYTFTDKYGFPLLINKGQAWVSAVTNINEVTFAP